MMWDLNGVWSEGRSAQMTSYNALANEIHVLLVDHDHEDPINTVKLLELCQYKVTFVQLASVAMSVLSNGKVKFDMVMANINSPDLNGFKLLQQAVSMGLPVILMSVDDNSFLAMRALENGALLFIKKPTTMEMMKCLWQHVVREKMRLMRDEERFREMAAAAAADYNNLRGIDFREVTNDSENNNVNGGLMGNNLKSKKKMKGQLGYDWQNHMMMEQKVKRKVCTEWTQELHSKFMSAVQELGDGRCFPKEILEMMNVEGLTRMQVASHLQKCRNANWRSPEERKSLQIVPSDSEESQPRARRFGSMPRQGNGPSYPFQGQETPEAGHGSGIHSDITEMPNNDVHVNLEIAPAMTNNTPPIHQPYGSLVYDHSNPANPRHPSDEYYYNFPDMDSLIQSFSVLQQGSGMNNPNSAPPYFYDRNYPGQHPGMPRMDSSSRGHWNSEKANFGNDNPDTSQGHEK